MGYLNSVLLASGIQADASPVSGGGLSQNSKFSYGYASSPGKRSSMEDFYEARIDGVDGEIVGLFGVFDGHGGARAAQYVKQNLFSNLIRHPKFFSDTKSAIGLVSDWLWLVCMMLSCCLIHLLLASFLHSTRKSIVIPTGVPEEASRIVVRYFTDIRFGRMTKHTIVLLD